MLLHQKVTNFNAYLTYKRLKVLFSAQKTRLMYMNQCKTSRLNTKNWEYYDFIHLGVISKSTPNFTPKNCDMERYFVIS